MKPRPKTTTIPIEEYKELRKHRKETEQLLADITDGIKDILSRKIEEA